MLGQEPARTATVFLQSDTAATTFFVVRFSVATNRRWRLFHWEAGG